MAADLTLRDLIREARAAGAPLRRDHTTTSDIPEYWECWDNAAGRRRVLVRCWRPADLWRIDMNGHHDDDHSIHVAMVNPTTTELVAAARLCGWDLAVDRGEAR